MLKIILIPIFALLVTTSTSTAFTHECDIPNFDQDSGLYHGISTGATLIRIKEFEDFSIEKTGVCVDLFHGYRCCDFPIQFEQKISFNCHCFGKISQENKFVNEKDHGFTTLGFTENIIFDFADRTSTGPYIGIGAGYKQLRSERRDLVTDRGVKRKVTTVGLQGIIGLNYRIWPVMDCQFEYKCFRAKKYGFMEHSLCVNFKAFL